MRVWLYQVRGSFYIPALTHENDPPLVTQLYLSPERVEALRAKRSILPEQGIPVILNNPCLEGLYDAAVRAIFGEKANAVAGICEFSIRDVKFLGTQELDVGGPKSFPKA